MNWIARLFAGIALSGAISLPALAGEGPYLRVGGGMSLGREGLSHCTPAGRLRPSRCPDWC